MNKVELEIKQEDIDKAIEEFMSTKDSMCSCCIVSQAIKRQLGAERVSTGLSSVRIYDKDENVLVKRYDLDQKGCNITYLESRYWMLVEPQNNHPN